MESATTNNPANRDFEAERNPDGTFKKGFSGNPSGRPKNTLKDYMRQKFMAMSEEEKEAFLAQIPAEIQWKMAEGNPKQDTDSNVTVELPKPIMDVHSDNSDSEGKES